MKESEDRYYNNIMIRYTQNRSGSQKNINAVYQTENRVVYGFRENKSAEDREDIPERTSGSHFTRASCNADTSLVTENPCTPR